MAVSLAFFDVQAFGAEVIVFAIEDSVFENVYGDLTDDHCHDSVDEHDRGSERELLGRGRSLNCLIEIKKHEKK